MVTWTNPYPFIPLLPEDDSSFVPTSGFRTTCTLLRGLHRPLRGFAVALSLIARPPTRVGSFLFEYVYIVFTDKATHVSRE